MDELVIEDVDRDLADLLQVLYGRTPVEPALRQWLEYQAYVQLVRWLRARGELPEEFGDTGQSVIGEDYDEAVLLDRLGQARLRIEARDGYLTQTEQLLIRLRDTGSPLFDRICELYCHRKSQLDFANELAAAYFIAKGIVVDLSTGLPITTLIALLIKSGALDRLCNCKGRLAAQ